MKDCILGFLLLSSHLTRTMEEQMPRPEKDQRLYSTFSPLQIVLYPCSKLDTFDCCGIVSPYTMPCLLKPLSFQASEEPAILLHI